MRKRYGRRSAWVRRAFSRLAVTAVTAPLIGCVLNQTADREVADTIARFSRERTQAGEAYARGTRPAPRTTTRPSPPAESARPEPSSLREYIILALEQNADIKAAEEMARMRAARVPQATALPDPMVMTRTLPQPSEFADGSNYFTLGVQQFLPVPEKLDRAGRVALQEARMALQELQRARLDAIADVKRAYFRMYIIDRTIEVDRTNQDLLRGLIDVARAQVASARRRQDDVLRAQVELSSLESQLVELQQERVTTAAMLNRLLSRPPSTPVPTLEEFDLRSAELQLDSLIAAAAERSPDLQRLREQLERDRQAVELARLAYWPDFTLGFEWTYMRPRAAFVPPPDPTTGMTPMVDRMSEAGMDSWAILFGANIPVWIEKIEAGIREARSRLAASQHEYVAAKNRVGFEIEDALARVRAQQELAAIFGSTIVPQAQQAYEVSRVAYSAGDSEFLFVIDNWQKWLTFTIQYHRALGELERGIADLEAAIGMSLEDVGGRS